MGSVAKQMGEEIIRLLVLAALGVLIAFAVVEAGLRLAGLPSSASGSIPSAYDLEGESIGPFRAGARVGVAWPPELAFEASFNSLGCRGAEPRDVDAPPLLAMGDSLTFGLGVDDPDTWPAILDRLLYEEGRARPVVNLSNAYMIMEDHLGYLGRALSELRPGMVMLMVPSFVGRVHLVQGGETFHQAALARERERRSWPRGLIRSLAIYEARTYITLWRRWLSLQSRGETPSVRDLAGAREPDTPGLREHIGSELQEFAARVEAGGARLLLLPYPLTLVEGGRARFLEPWTQRLARELDIPYVDLTRAFQAQPDPSALLQLPYDFHTSARGNAVVAEAVLEVLEGLPPR
jgi:lysophospholipase L1-like esterase